MYILESRLLKWGIYTNAIYVLLLFLFSPDGINFLNIFITSFLVLSAVVIFIVCFNNFKYLKELSKNTRMLFYWLLAWGIIIIVRSFSLEIQDWVTNFGNIYMALSWLMPITLLVGLKIQNWKIIFDSISFMFTLMFLSYLSLPFFKLNEEWIQLLRPINFMLLIGLYHFGCIGKIKAYIIIFIYINIAIMSSRRLEFLFLGLVFSLLLLDKLKHIKLKNTLVKYILFIFIMVFMLIFTIGYEHFSNMIASIVEFQDSRTFLFKEFFMDLNLNDKIFGRGSLGTYYSDFFERTTRYYKILGKKGWRGDDPERITVEVGYLQMILKGGFILLLLNVIIYIKAIYLAVFKSSNKFIKRLGYYILIITILSLIELRPTFTPTFLILWVAIGTVLVKKYRNMSNEEINLLIK